MEQFFSEDFPFFPLMQGMSGDLAADVFEKDNNVIVEMNLPGIDPEKVEISVQDNYMRIAGSREEKQETKDKHYVSKEIRRGSFERIVRLPAAVEDKEANAEYDHGVLRVTIPKKKAVKPETIKIQVKNTRK
jgi:HSP20 family protein